MSDIPEWAKDRAYALSYQGEARFDDPDSFMISRVARAFARYISEHEEPPVDPFAECIKLILGGFEGERHAQQYADSLRGEMAKRGLKIVREQS